MTKHAVEPGSAQAFVDARRARILEGLGRSPRPAGAGAEPLPPAGMEHLVREAEELYWNELSWEELTDEEVVVGGHLTEMAFPALLAFIDGLLLSEPTRDPARPARPHPDAVEEILLFLGERSATFTRQLEQGADSERVVWARAMTVRLVDLVLYRLYRLTSEEREEIERSE